MGERTPAFPIRRGWPHPTFSPESADAFLERARPSESERKALYAAFRPLPRKALDTKTLLAGAKTALRLWDFVSAVRATEAGSRNEWLTPLAEGLNELCKWALHQAEINSIAKHSEQMLAQAIEKYPPTAPLSDEGREAVLYAAVARVTQIRRSLDRRDPKLSCAVNVLAVAREKGLRPPSDAELAALSVLRGPDAEGERPTTNDAQRKESWRTTRKRAAWFVQQLEPFLREEREAAKKFIELEVLKKILEEQHALASKSPRADAMRRARDRRAATGGTESP